MTDYLLKMGNTHIKTVNYFLYYYYFLVFPEWAVFLCPRADLTQTAFSRLPHHVASRQL